VLIIRRQLVCEPVAKLVQARAKAELRRGARAQEGVGEVIVAPERDLKWQREALAKRTGACISRRERCTRRCSTRQRSNAASTKPVSAL
jgi:hypothetical protein